MKQQYADDRGNIKNNYQDECTTKGARDLNNEAR